ncbi:JAB domain-containing protein [Comamonas flocculans]|uniref:MPN domain-containing protein n=1 Tax=Comamonas flocculans TaxID=2597701 RepID=A0A5B8RW74_9BURK|nr:hypothetical protein FOZ74_12470 [Comamonas flocculans]
MVSTYIATPPKKRPAELRAHKAGECLPVYGLPSDSAALRPRMRARDRAVIERALSILGSYLGSPGAVLDNPQAVREYLRLQLAGEPIERFAVLYLNSQHRGIAFECHAIGTLTQSVVHPREIAEAAMRHRAASVVLAHNHPSGNTEPSRADETLTQTLKHALAWINVRVLDHVIVGGDRALSMAERGLI